MPPGSSIAPARADRAARIAGMLLLFTAAVTVVMAAMRVLGDTDQPTLIESLQAVGDNRVIYGVGGAARSVSGVAFLAAGWYLSKAWITRNRLVAPLVAYLLIASGAITAVSGVCAILIAVLPTSRPSWRRSPTSAGSPDRSASPLPVSPSSSQPGISGGPAGP